MVAFGKRIACFNEPTSRICIAYCSIMSLPIFDELFKNYHRAGLSILTFVPWFLWNVAAKLSRQKSNGISRRHGLKVHYKLIQFHVGAIAMFEYFFCLMPSVFDRLLTVLQGHSHNISWGRTRIFLAKRYAQLAALLCTQTCFMY